MPIIARGGGFVLAAILAACAAPADATGGSRDALVDRGDAGALVADGQVRKAPVFGGCTIEAREVPVLACTRGSSDPSVLVVRLGAEELVLSDRGPVTLTLDGLLPGKLSIVAGGFRSATALSAMSGTTWTQEVDVARAPPYTAKPIVFVAPFDAWPVTFLTTARGATVEARPVTVPTGPWKAADTRAPYVQRTSFLRGKVGTIDLVASERGAVTVNVRPAGSPAFDVDLPGPGTYVIEADHVRNATAGELAGDAGAP